MATKYWVGGNGNWSSTTNWRTASNGTTITSAPGSADAAVLDANSGASIVTVDSNITVQTLACAGFTGTLAFGSNTITVTGTSTVFSGSTTMTVTGTPLVILSNSATSGTRTINASAVTEANSISFNIINGSGTAIITITGAGAVRDLNFTGFTGSHNATSYTMYGSLTLGTGMIVTAGSTTTFAATSGTKTITTNSVTFDKNITFNGAGGTWQLQDALTSGSTRVCTLTAGTLNLNNLTLTTGLFSSNNANARTIVFGSGNITITGVSGTVFAGPNSTNTGLTTTGTAQVNITGNGTTTRTVNPGNPAAITGFISFTISAGSDTITSTAGMTFNNLTFTSGFTGIFDNVTRSIFGNLTLNSAITSFSSGASTLTFTGTGSQTITTAGKTIDCPITFNGIGGTFACQDALTLGSNRTLTLTNGTLQLKSSTTNTVGSLATSGTTQKYLQSTISGTQTTITKTGNNDTLFLDYLTLQDINANSSPNTTIWYAGMNSISNGNVTGWTFTRGEFLQMMF